MTIPTYVVAIEGLTSRVNNFFMLPSSFIASDNSCRIMVHTDPSVDFVGDDLAFNFDLLIDAEDSKTRLSVSELAFDRKVTIPRESKPTQWAKLRKAAKYFPTYSFILPDCYHARVSANACSSEINQWALGPMTNGTLVVKPKDGARGIGQTKINFNDYPVTKYTMALRDASTMADLQINIQALGNRPQNAELTTQLVGDEVVAEVGSDRLEDSGNVTHASEVVVSRPERETNSREGIESLKSQGFMAHRFIPDITGEWRILVLPDCTIYVCPRGRKGAEGFLQATGVPPIYNETSTGRLTPIQESDISHIAGELSAIITNIGFEFGSMDLFTTANGWGIFEYCNQFGVEAFIPSEMAWFHQRAVEIWLKRYIFLNTHDTVSSETDLMHIAV